MTRRRVPSVVTCLYLAGCAGALCYAGGLISALCHQQVWMIAALGTSMVLLAGITAILVADYWVWTRRARALVRDVEAWMREGARRDDGHRRR